MADDKPKNADFIGRVVKDAKNPVETRMLSGWFGDSGAKGTRRLYTDAELTSYVDIPDDAILYTEPIKDSQPAGGVLVWINRDASVQSGGSAASRAGQFLQGQVATDFGAAGSLEKAGLRCVTEVPCGEPTGFTGQCTKQPNVGGAWPCITAVPFCVEVTGFTGKCTHAPWPSPTRYIGCTYLHCPTNDLTHIPHICNIVASGQPGCVVVNPPQGGEAEKNAAVGASEKFAETALPGCGYTKTWGLCETHLLGCGYTKSWGLCPTRPEICDPAGGQQANAAFGAPAPIITIRTPVPEVCPSLGITCTIVQCTVTKPPTELCTPAPGVCETFCGPQCQTKQVAPLCTSVNCVPPPTSPQLECTMTCTRIGPTCPVPTVSVNPPQCNTTPQPVGMNAAQTPICAAGTVRPTMWTQIQCPPTQLLGCGYTQPPQCPVASVICATNFCLTEACGLSQVCQPGGGGQKQQFAQQAAGGPQTLATVCTQFGCQQTHQLGCPTRGIDCTVICPTHQPLHCPTAPAGVCPTHLHPCPTQLLPHCPTAPATICPTHLPAACPPPLSAPPHCPTVQLCPVTAPPQCPLLSAPPNCPTVGACQSIACQSQACQPGGGGIEQQQAQFVGGPAQTLATVCTQFGTICRTQPNGDCTFFGGCGPTQPNVCKTHQLPCPTGGIDCTVICPTHHIPACPTKQFECTMFCTHGAPGCGTAVVQCFPPLSAPPQCPQHSGFNCPSAICPQSIACQSQACQPGGGQQQQAQFVGAPQTLATVCTQIGCPTHAPFLCKTPHQPCVSPGIDCTVIVPRCHTPHVPCVSPHPECTMYVCTHAGPQCPTSPATICPTHLPGTCPLSAPPNCPTVQLCPVTAPPQCPLLSAPPNCPTVGACQSIACQSQACQPGGGQQHQQQFAAVGAQQFTPATVCTQYGCTQWGPGCPPTPATVCTQPDVCPPQQAQAFAAPRPQTLGGPGCETLIPTCYVCTGHPCHTLYLRCPILP